MKKILFLFLSLSVSLAFSQYKESDYHFYSNKSKLDKNFSNKRLSLTTLKSEYRPYAGIEITYDKSEYLFCTPKTYRSYGLDRALPQIATLRWENNLCYDKNGLMVLKFQMGLKNSGYVEEMFYRNRDNKILRTGQIGDFLFQSTTQEILKVLESVGINPVSIYEKGYRSELISNLDKIFTPGGQFWEFSMGGNFGVWVLIDDKTKKVIAKTYDNSPKAISNQLIEMYGFRRNSAFYPQSINSIINQKQISKIWNIAQQTHYNDEVESPHVSRVQLLTKNIWKVDTSNNSRRIYLWIDNATGEILVDSEDFPKNYLGEEDYKKAVNLILKGESIKAE